MVNSISARYCPVCGKGFTFAEATLWIDGQDEACTIRLPVCLACNADALIKNDLAVSTPVVQALDAGGWKQADIEALSETGQRKINSLIEAAEIAVALRRGELFGPEGDPSEEKAAVDAELLGLHSLRSMTEANKSPVRRITAANDLAA